jgi:hypothetical protein
MFSADRAPIKRAAISGATANNNTLVPAVAGKRIRVLQFALVCASAVNVTFQSDTGTALTGAMPFGANGGISTAFNEGGHFETAAGELLGMRLSSAVQVSGWLSYQEVD